MFSAEVKPACSSSFPGDHHRLHRRDPRGPWDSPCHAEGASGRRPVASTRCPSVKVLDEEGREVEPGSGETGMVAVGGEIPDGYYKDEQDGLDVPRRRRGALLVPRRLGDGRGRRPDQPARPGHRKCINTGGEKVFPEEVEEVVKTHPAIEDCLVFGVPDERFGQRVVGVVARRRAVPTDIIDDDVIAGCRAQLAAFKAPRSVTFVAHVPRAANGKADYRTAKAMAGGPPTP